MKKLFAVILALSMIAAMLPAGTAFAADEAVEQYEYIFGSAAFNLTENKNVPSNSFVPNGCKWKWLCSYGGTEGETVQAHGLGFLRFQTSSKSNSSESNDVDDNVVVFQLYIGSTDRKTPAEAGVYIPKVARMDSYKTTYNGITDLYLVSETARSKNNWKVTSLYEVQTIIGNAAKLGSGNESATADVIHLSSEDTNKNSTSGVNEVAEKVYLTGGYYYLIATISKPTTWTDTELNKTNYTENEVFGNFSNITFTREADDTELTKAFTAQEATHNAATKNVYLYKSTDTTNAVVKHEAVTTDTVTVSTTDTENFIYWAQGLTNEKKILSFEPSFDYTPSEGNNYLVAVYRDTANKAEFFNANGQREAVLLADGTAPALPERVGYEPATAWVDLDGNTVAPGATVTVSGYNSYVPNYGKLKTVEVNGVSYNYGEPVTLNCTDVAYYQEGKYFKGWKKDDVIVSTDDSYSFLAYKNTDVEPVWANEPFNFSGSGRKIVLDLFNNALMAEFIGFGDNVVEKGIMFTDTTDTTKTRNIAMTTDSSQFVIIPDEEGTYKGYAIVEDSDGTQTLVTDGEYINAAE